MYQPYLGPSASIPHREYTVRVSPIVHYLSEKKLDDCVGDNFTEEVIFQKSDASQKKIQTPFITLEHELLSERAADEPAFNGTD